MTPRSAPRFAWVLNLEAEYELAHANYTPPERLRRQLERYGAASRALLGSGDRLIEDGSAGLAGFIGRAWCPTPRALEKLCSARAEPEPHPAASVLKRVNHRLFAHEQGGGLPGQRYVRALSEIDALPRSEEEPWLLKRPLAFAGRGQLRVYSRLDDKQRAWIRASLQSDGLIAEPLVAPTLEVSLHGFVWRDGRHELGRVCVQEVTARGVFRAIRLARDGELESLDLATLLARAEQVACALTAAGYFGPFGIDAYRYHYRSQAAFCTLSEINARYTMGFLTGFPRHPRELAL